MKPYYEDDSVTLYHGDCIEVMRALPDNSVDAVVCDPPYGLGFMGREWDSIKAGHLPPSSVDKGSPLARMTTGKGPAAVAFDGVAFQEWCTLWTAECLRVLKPGGHMLAFGGSRTWHRLACAVEDAGFEVRDSIAWLYGSGFPKSLDVSKAITGAQMGHGSNSGAIRRATMGDAYEASGRQGNRDGAGRRDTGLNDHTLALTPDAEQWQGWGTALKPAFEPIVVGRKPLAGTVAANVLAHGTGALNIDGCRVGDEVLAPVVRGVSKLGTSEGADGNVTAERTGRWPTNVVLDDSQAAELDRQSGVLTSGKPGDSIRAEQSEASVAYADMAAGSKLTGYGDSGGASRFFPTFRYEAKASTSERPRYKREGAGEGRVIAGTVKQCAECGSKTIAPGAGGSPACGHDKWEHVPVERRDEFVAHPTVKPLDLMRWLVRLVTPPGGTVLEPFAGSGTTAEACVVEGFRCIAIEREADYLPLIVQRLTKPIEPVLDFTV